MLRKWLADRRAPRERAIGVSWTDLRGADRPAGGASWRTPHTAATRHNGACRPASLAADSMVDSRKHPHPPTAREVAMPDTNWMIKGREFAHCNCAYGCPCQFNAPPTHGDCKAIVGFQIDEGSPGSTRLDLKTDDRLAVAVRRW